MTITTNLVRLSRLRIQAMEFVQFAFVCGYERKQERRGWALAPIVMILLCGKVGLDVHKWHGSLYQIRALHSSQILYKKILSIIIITIQKVYSPLYLWGSCTISLEIPLKLQFVGHSKHVDGVHFVFETVSPKRTGGVTWSSNGFTNSCFQS